MQSSSTPALWAIYPVLGYISGSSLHFHTQKYFLVCESHLGDNGVMGFTSYGEWICSACNAHQGLLYEIISSTLTFAFHSFLDSSTKINMKTVGKPLYNNFWACFSSTIRALMAELTKLSERASWSFRPSDLLWGCWHFASVNQDHPKLFEANRKRSIKYIMMGIYYERRALVS